MYQQYTIAIKGINTFPKLQRMNETYTSQSLEMVAKRA